MHQGHNALGMGRLGSPQCPQPDEGTRKSRLKQEFLEWLDSGRMPTQHWQRPGVLFWFGLVFVS